MNKSSFSQPPTTTANRRHGKIPEDILFADLDEEDAARLTAQIRQRIAGEVSQFLAVRVPGRAKVEIVNPPADDPRGDVTVVHIVNDDMPFLLDSTLACLTGAGHEIRLILHPVIQVERDASGKLKTVHAKTGLNAAGRAESLIVVEIEQIDSRRERDALRETIVRVLADVRVCVLDWRAMQTRVKDVINRYQANPPPVSVDELTEAMAFVQWLVDDHFLFLGLREFAFDGPADGGDLKPIADSGLGILRNRDIHVLTDKGSRVSLSPQIRQFLLSPAPVFVTKSDVLSTVHRRAVMDYVGIKQYDEGGALVGELRIVGLFTSTAYTRSPRDIPYLRRKIFRVMEASGYALSSHSGKGLLNVLENFPRDELFQMETDELADMALAIYRLEERPRTRLFVRRDKFDRFVSAFVFISRDRFSSTVRRRIGDYLAKSFHGQVESFSPAFGAGVLVRVHFIITRDRSRPVDIDVAALEDAVVDMARTWDDRLGDALAKAFAPDEARRLRRKYRDSFSPAYCDSFSPDEAIHDIRHIEALPTGESVDVHVFRPRGEAADRCRFKLYHHETPVALSSRLPILENIGLKAIEENTYRLTRFGTRNTRDIFIHEVQLETADGSPLDLDAFAEALHDGFLAVWNGLCDNDRLNALFALTGANWRDVVVLRAVLRYLRQCRITYSFGFMAGSLVRHPAIASKLIALFHARLDPALKGSRKKREQASQALVEDILADLQAVPSLDEDRIVRRIVNVIMSIWRTNFFQPHVSDDPDGSAVAFKINSKAIEELPAPRPFAEIFVYSPRIEGIHLRGGKIARGGLRWSDRPEDYRTEVLGLAKAQNVKNALIVPTGAKGGFVPKRLAGLTAREDIFAEGKAAYKIFISSLLDVTDNLVGDKVVPPAHVVRHDDDDPYLVVAADKGTATFSDTANAIAEERGFWLGDAFASGGSAGYDHKAMGITARGAWEAVKRHFREMDIDIQTTPFTVIGVGDMSGDVFGNGMLLSRKIRLLAAFDHRDIFIDPDPDEEASFIERQRLFALPRSSWADYDRKLISAGGGVFSRASKAIALTSQMRKLTGLSADSAAPDEIISALLKAPADLLWFGGIGTYVRGPQETNADVGDRANDTVRVSADQLRAKVIGEGANLGITQQARIAYALRGGRINTDAIDNSAGVNTSDVEVNIKIALGSAQKDGRLTGKQRNRLLQAMTDDVAALVLANNYRQTLAITLAHWRGRKEVEYLGRAMRMLEQRGLLDRDLEGVPDDAELLDREGRGQGLTRPELAVLLAYAKISLADDLLASTVPDDPYLEGMLKGYFPPAMNKRFSADIDAHRLRREIITTVLGNAIIDHGGPSFVTRLSEETGHSSDDIARAFAIAYDVFGFADLYRLVDDLDNLVPGAVQVELYIELQRTLRRITVWYLRNVSFAEGMAAVVEAYRGGVAEFRSAVSAMLARANMKQFTARRDHFAKAGIDNKAVDLFAGLPFLQRAPDIVQIAKITGHPVAGVGRVYFEAGYKYGVADLIEKSIEIEPRNFFERVATNRTLDAALQTHRQIVTNIFASAGKSRRPLEDWLERNAAALARARRAIDELLGERGFDLAKLALAAGQLADLAAEAR